MRGRRGEDPDSDGVVAVGARRRAAPHLDSTRIRHVTHFEQVWRKAYARSNPGKFCRAFTAKERGQARNIMQAVPEAELYRVLNAVVGGWSRFAEYVRVIAKVNAPDEPHVGFLLRHCQHAVNLVREVVTPVLEGTAKAPAVAESNRPWWKEPK